MKVNIKWNNEDLVIEGNFHEGYKGKMYNKDGSPGDPPEPASFEIDEIVWRKMKVDGLLCSDDRVLEEIEKIVIEAIINQEPDDERI